MSKNKITRNFALLLVACSLSLMACGGGNSTPESKVKDFALNFAENLKNNRLDSLQDVYEDIILADSIVAPSTEEIKVSQISPGLYMVTFANNITMQVRQDTTNNITVEETRGLFAFPETELHMARKTGLWNDSLNDARLSERMADRGFFDYIALRAKAETPDIITVEKAKDGKSYVLTNTSDAHVKGSDYEIVKRYGNPMREETITSESEPGQDIPAHETINIVTEKPKGASMEVVSIRFTLPDDDFNKKFAAFSGNEYQEYLGSKNLTLQPDSVSNPSK